MIPLPPLNFTGGAAGPSNAAGGMASSPWNQGDFVVSTAGAATSGARTAPAGGELGLSPGVLMAGAVIVGAALLWKRFR